MRRRGIGEKGPRRGKKYTEKTREEERRMELGRGGREDEEVRQWNGT